MKQGVFLAAFCGALILVGCQQQTTEPAFKEEIKLPELLEDVIQQKEAAMRVAESALKLRVPNSEIFSEAEKFEAISQLYEVEEAIEDRRVLVFYYDSGPDFVMHRATFEEIRDQLNLPKNNFIDEFEPSLTRDGIPETVRLTVIRDPEILGNLQLEKNGIFIGLSTGQSFMKGNAFCGSLQSGENFVEDNDYSLAKEFFFQMEKIDEEFRAENPFSCYTYERTGDESIIERKYLEDGTALEDEWFEDQLRDVILINADNLVTYINEKRR